jgi:hypothetical protein
MTHAQEMIRTHPGEPVVDIGVLARCIEACYDCAQSCTACADACLGEQDVQMLVCCIRLNLDCADVCATTGRLLARQVEFDPALGDSGCTSLRSSVSDLCRRVPAAR